MATDKFDEDIDDYDKETDPCQDEDEEDVD